MKKIFIALLLITTGTNAEEQKPLATQAGESIAPYAQAFGETVSNTMMEFMAGGKGPLAEGARTNLQMQEQRERVANRGTRKSMKECIKPENVIDDCSGQVFPDTKIGVLSADSRSKTEGGR